MFLTSLMVYLVGILGLIINHKSLIHLILSLELLLLGVAIMLLSLNNFNNLDNQLMTIYLITLAGSESAIGLSLLVRYYKIRGSISILP